MMIEDVAFTNTSSVNTQDWLNAVKDILITAFVPVRDTEIAISESISWAGISEKAFEDWDNEEDAIYDEL